MANRLVDQIQELWREQMKVDRPGPGRRKADWTVRDLPTADRPRERLAALGAEALSQQELIACLLGRGGSGESVVTLAQKLLSRFGSIRGIADASLEELARTRGIGRAKAVQLKAACELSRRLEQIPVGGTGRPVEGTQEAAQLVRRHLAGRKKEHFLLILLDSRHRVLKAAPISVGSLDMSVVHPRETFREAIMAGAAAILLAHNHPSGDPTPSEQDLDLTRRLVEAGHLLGIPVLDHLIVGNGEPLSLRAGGWMEEGR